MLIYYTKQIAWQNKYLVHILTYMNIQTQPTPYNKVCSQEYVKLPINASKHFKIFEKKNTETVTH